MRFHLFFTLLAISLLTFSGCQQAPKHQPIWHKSKQTFSLLKMLGLPH